MRNEIGCASEEDTKKFWDDYKDEAYMYIAFWENQIDMKNQT